VAGPAPCPGIGGRRLEILNQTIQVREQARVLAKDRSHGGRKAGHSGDCLLEEPALFLLRKMIGEVIPQVMHRLKHIGPSIGCRRAGIGEGRSDGEQQVEKVAVLSEHVAQDHRVGTVDRRHGKNLLETESIQALLCLEKGMLEET